MEVFENKLRKAFHFFDLNKDGYVSKEELAKVADNISSLSNSTDAEAKVTRQEWTKWCDLIVYGDQVTEEDFVSLNIRAGADETVERVKRENVLTYTNMFEILDTNKDGFISPEELRLYYEAFGYGDDYDIDQIFRMMDTNNDGLISRDEFVTAGTIYWSNEPGYEYFYDIPQK